MTKKILITLLSVLMLMSLVGCGNKKEVSEEVTIVLPTYLVLDEGVNEEEVTQELIDELFGSDHTVKKAVLNEDGTVSITMDKKEHEKMMAELEEAISESLADIMDDEMSEITSIEPKNHYSEFDVHVSGSEVNVYDSFMSMVLTLQGESYNLFNGTPVESIDVRYYDKDGNLID